MRLLVWFKVMGDNPPQIIPQALVDYLDFALATSAYTLDLPIFQAIPEPQRSQKLVWFMALQIGSD